MAKVREYQGSYRAHEGKEGGSRKANEGGGREREREGERERGRAREREREGKRTELIHSPWLYRLSLLEKLTMWKV